MEENNYIEPTPENIIRVVCERFELNRDDIKVQRGNRKLCAAKHFCYYLMKSYTILTLNEMSKAVGANHDHTSVMSGINLIKIKSLTEAKVQSNIEYFTSVFGRTPCVISDLQRKYDELLQAYIEEKRKRKQLERQLGLQVA